MFARGTWTKIFWKNWLESGFTWRLNGNWPWVSVHFQKNWTRTGFEFQNQNQNLFVSRTIFLLITKGEYGIEHDEYFLMTETLNFTIQRKYDTVPTIDVQHKIICKRSNWGRGGKKKRKNYLYFPKLLKIGWDYYYKCTNNSNTRCILHL